MWTGQGGWVGCGVGVTGEVGLADQAQLTRRTRTASSNQPPSLPRLDDDAHHPQSQPHHAGHRDELVDVSGVEVADHLGLTQVVDAGLQHRQRSRWL